MDFASDNTMKHIVLQRMGRCRVCHRQPSPADIELVSRDADVWTMVVECPECHAKSFVAAVLNEGDAEKAALALRRLNGEIEAELEAVGEEAALDGEPITVDDVLELHRFLQTFHGDFKALFGGGSLGR
jgi:hypothetical protein